MKKETKTRVKRTMKKTEVEPVVSEPMVTAPSVSAVPASLPKGVTIAGGVLLGLAVIGGVLYNRYWNIATVNGKPISRLAYYQTIEKQAGKQALDNMIMETLILDEAEKNNVSVAKEEVDAQISQIETQMKSQNTTLETALAEEGMTRTDLERQIRIQQLVNIMGASASAITDEQINAFVEENKDTLPKEATPDELKDIARQQLSQSSENDSIRSWLADIRAKATINYY